jgi:hypothetical protein
MGYLQPLLQLIDSRQKPTNLIQPAHITGHEILSKKVASLSLGWRPFSNTLINQILVMGLSLLAAHPARADRAALVEQQVFQVEPALHMPAARYPLEDMR